MRSTFGIDYFCSQLRSRQHVILVTAMCKEESGSIPVKNLKPSRTGIKLKTGMKSSQNKFVCMQYMCFRYNLIWRNLVLIELRADPGSESKAEEKLESRSRPGPES
ncbi:hypothetical protein EVAR_59676_1 [Eumeta japonica]|uniref:Uncharacterized protein n=1 Tax=Eumeta variegata TaxID=151549 RepID=A0A4C1ZLE5_EUMVA|nr:hypothetical protein EVAR_59676_1 [Eumeta japonica]